MSADSWRSDEDLVVLLDAYVAVIGDGARPALRNWLAAEISQSPLIRPARGSFRRRQSGDRSTRISSSAASVHGNFSSPANTPAEKKWLRPADITERFGLEIKTLANQRSKGEGPPFRKWGGRVFYLADEVEAWLANGRPNRPKKPR